MKKELRSVAQVSSLPRGRTKAHQWKGGNDDKIGKLVRANQTNTKRRKSLPERLRHHKR